MEDFPSETWATAADLPGAARLPACRVAEA